MSIKGTFLAGALLLAVSGTSHAAATLTTSFATWVANREFPATTSSIPLTGGGTLTANPDGDAILQTLTDWGPWTSAAGPASMQISQTFLTGETAFVAYHGGPETSMTISVQNATDFAFGDIRAVPEPGSLVLLASGMGMAALVRRQG
jgi:hypothetical protein